METPDSVREYWFGSTLDDAAIAAERASFWWSKNPEVDDAIRRRFENYVIKAASEDLTDWTSNPQGRLALILLTDQFPRNIFRDSPKAFAFDSHALALCRDGLDTGCDLELRPIERVFFYLPLEHSELLTNQEQSVSLFEKLVHAIGANQKPPFEEYLDFAVRHRDIIKRFGRFPHRNKVLGRVSTPEELSFLEQSGSSF